MISIQSSKTFKVLENRNFIFSQLETSSNPRDGAQEDFRKKKMLKTQNPMISKVLKKLTHDLQ